MFLFQNEGFCMTKILYNFLFFVSLLSNSIYAAEESHYIENFHLYSQDIENSFVKPSSLLAILNDEITDNLNAIKSTMQSASKAMFLAQKQNIINKTLPFAILFNISLESYIEKEINKKTENFIDQYKKNIREKATDLRNRMNDPQRNYSLDYKVIQGTIFVQNSLKFFFQDECQMFIEDMKAYINNYCRAFEETLKEHFSNLAQFSPKKLNDASTDI